MGHLAPYLLFNVSRLHDRLAKSSILRLKRLDLDMRSTKFEWYVTFSRLGQLVFGWLISCELNEIDMDKPSHFLTFRIAAVIAYQSLCDLKEREKKHLLTEILKIKGLMPLLMKPRNEQLWTPDELEELRIHLRRL